MSGSIASDFSLDDLRAVLGRPVSEEQAAVVTAPLAPGVVVAGAGSGKTATMVARVVWLVATGHVRPEGVLGLTFTAKAADELAVRVRLALRRLAAAGRLPRSNAPDPEGPSSHAPSLDVPHPGVPSSDMQGPDEQDEPSVSTYHAYAARLVREHALRIGREPSSRLLTPASSWQLAARAVSTYDGRLDAVDRAESTVIRAVLALAGDLAEHLVEPGAVRTLGEQLVGLSTAAGVKGGGRDALATQRMREQLLPLVERYTARKRERDLLDFGDVVALAARLARECPEVGQAERAAFPVVLLDEYQDTGAAQEVLLSALFGTGHAVLAVGDPCQSIYGWRGASAGTLRRFPARFPARVPAAGDGPGPPPLHLSTTYRNGGRILLLANVVSADLRTHGLPVPELVAAPGREHDGEVRCALLPDVRAEAQWVAGSVREAVLALGGAPDGGPRWADAAVLCRKRAMFPLLRAAFESSGVPVEVVGLGGLLDVPEVADLVATLRVLDEPTADAALLRLLTGARWRIGPRDLVALGRRARALGSPGESPDDPVEAVVLGGQDDGGGSLVEALDALDEGAGTPGLSSTGAQRLRVLRDELRLMRRRLDQPLPELVGEVERTLGLDVEVVVRPGAPGPVEARADLDAFTDAAARFAGDAARDGTGEAVLSAFLAYLAAAEDEEHGLDVGTPSAADTVKLMTVHAAKGLEWPVVAVPGLAASTKGNGSQVFPGRPKGTSWLSAEKLLPFPLRGDADELPRLTGLTSPMLATFAAELRARDQREEQRLAYVAFTRAESLLLCSGYHWGEGKTVVGPSVLLHQAREACVAGAGRVDRWEEPGPRPEQELSGGDAEQHWPPLGPPAGVGAQRAAERVRALLEPGEARPELLLSAEAAERVARWDDELALLAQEQARRAAARTSPGLPGALSVTALVEAHRDPAALARSLRRPLPRQPSPVSRRGTAFHAWLEQVYGRPALLGPDELPGAADAAIAGSPDLDALQEAFRRSAWWGRTPVEVEVPFEMSVDGVLVKGRMDAVFTRPEGGDEVVDWKTGRVPEGPAAEAAAVQLAAYRLAWSALSGAPVEQVSAAFHYVADDVTVRPDRLLDRAGLEALVRSARGAPEA